MRFTETGSLYVSDMDGTLLQSDGTLSAQTKRVIRDFIAAGGAFTLCTGRPTGLVLAIAQELGVQLPVLTYNGAMAFCMQQQRYIHHRLVPAPLAQSMLEKIKACGIDFVLYVLDKAGNTVLVHNRPTHPVMARFVTDHISYEHLVERYDPALSLQPGDQMVQIVAINTRETLAPLQRELLDALDIKVFLVECHGDPGQWFMEATSNRSTKGKGVNWLRAHLNAKQVVCFGDLLNDIPMFEVADTAVAMENAAADLKAIANTVTSCNDTHGVARFLVERYGLGAL